MFTLHHSALKVAASVAIVAAALPVGMAVAHDDGPSGLTKAQRTVIREATTQFKDVDVAIAAGYVPTDECVALPDGAGGMGYHFVQPQLISDNRIDPTMPEILVYQKDRSGKLKLGAVEYFVADDDQDLTTDADRPTLMSHPFEGPMAGHEEGMPVHFDLHVWLYRRNPAGELASWNPDVRCD